MQIIMLCLHCKYIVSYVVLFTTLLTVQEGCGNVLTYSEAQGIDELWMTVAEGEGLVVVVLSQADKYNAGLAQALRTSLLRQASALNQKPPTVYLTHEDFPHPGAWTVVPLLSTLQERHSNSSWFLFCEERTRINLSSLLSTLSQHDHTQELWMGHGLQDKEPTIIHHFTFADDSTRLRYPLLAAGFTLSAALLERLAEDAAVAVKPDFSIDAMHELAMFVKTPLLSLPAVFCLQNQSQCATHPMPFTPCGDAVPSEDIFFAVKTCLKHHQDRVPVVKKTWAQDAYNIEFFSDVQDTSVPTTAVGVANTLRGHCAKTFAIFKLALERSKQLPNLRWVVLADDDTLLSVPRLQTLLSCWSPDDAVVIGERYGYNIHSPLGYNYPTGGGGIAVSVTVLPTLATQRRCPTDDAPDDMYLGLSLSRLNVTLVHSPAFHQARPGDYPRTYLSTQEAVSFHKHWMLDPVSTYYDWLSPSKQPHLHTDL